jgi:hypothetical protein
MAAGAGQIKLAGLGLAFSLFLLLLGGPCERFLERLLNRIAPRKPKNPRRGPDLPPPDV